MPDNKPAKRQNMQKKKIKIILRQPNTDQLIKIILKKKKNSSVLEYVT